MAAGGGVIRVLVDAGASHRHPALAGSAALVLAHFLEDRKKNSCQYRDHGDHDTGSSMSVKPDECPTLWGKLQEGRGKRACFIAFL